MLPEVFVALAASGGTAVVQAAGTEAWDQLSARVAQWLGRGHTVAENAELERLNGTAGELRSANGSAQMRADQESLWRDRIANVLEGLESDEQQRAAAELQRLLAPYTIPHARPHGAGVVAQGDITVRADNQSIAAYNLSGGAHIGLPTRPDPSHG
ncbi:hypothetical protein J8N05_46185 [Streptomyces sp. BH-SS-21]|uniref:Uncharacterized protein n=1 Tax=Streptomyces liliiviolaceus TaxID=2823109 RepID=A0A940Y6N5_9ACTN|nr:hypothetical protein [Streptomyces liliiviolaceus]MBQ0855558.1 hypothetical protein [Streptomyces liliiviolaceus]